MNTKEDADRRYAQISGERDYHKRRAANLEQQRDQLAEALRLLVKEFPVPACIEEFEAVEQARAALRQLEEER